MTDKPEVTLAFKNCETHSEFQKTCTYCYEMSLGAAFGREGGLRTANAQLQQHLPLESDLAAVFEALEYFCEHTDWKIAEIRLYKDLPRDIRPKIQWRVEIFRPSYQLDSSAGKLQDAIMLAVLSASRDQVTHKEKA